MDRRIISLLEKFKEESELEDTGLTSEETIQFGNLIAQDISEKMSICLPGERIELKSLNPEGIMNYTYSGIKDSVRLNFIGYKINELGVWVEDVEKNKFYY